jgi:hypothetical protein
MRTPALLAAVAAVALSAPAFAQAPAGEYGDALSRMLTEAAAGTCSAELMAEQLLAACNQQIAQMAPGLQSLGAVQSVTFVSAQETPEGRMEVYTVAFAGGQSMTWFIGGRQPDGKFAAAGTQG